MSHLSEPEDVQLICSLFSPEERVVTQCLKDLVDLFGPTDWVSPALFFDRTRYYEKEMGWPLHRRFVAFRDFIRPEALVDAKIKTRELEERYAQGGKRRVNADPGYLSLERLVLATGKNYTHRIYLSKGVYADLTLVFQRGTFRGLEWTYRDYASPEMIEAFNGIRERYKARLRGISESMAP
jgi:hypothetical protein